MAIKQILTQKKLEQKKELLETARSELSAIQTRATEYEAAIDEAKTEDELTEIAPLVDAVTTELDEKRSAFDALELEVRGLEKEIEEMREKAEKATKAAQVTEDKKVEKTGNELRDEIKTLTIRETLEIDEVRDFYGRIAESVQHKRGLVGGELTVPLVILDRIQSRLGDYSVLYNEVQVERLSGEARAILAGDIPEAIWSEMTGAVQELIDNITPVEVDGWLLSGYLPIHNVYLEDSMINLAAHVEDRLAKSIAKALDKAILAGTGSAGKQPEGVIMSIPAANQVTTSEKIGAVLAQLGLVDTDGTGGEVIAVMNRKLYYAQFLPQLIATTSDGKTVTGSVEKPNLPGIRVVLSAYTPDDTVILGDFKQYLLAERAGVKIESSEHAKFIDNQTVFKGTSRYDGKALTPKSFAQVTIVPTP